MVKWAKFLTNLTKERKIQIYANKKKKNTREVSKTFV